ncbi:aldehyde ferredoxin oxidoreductase family protein [Clostridium grantii]|uniref:Aldehyde:ferredoxin oxidoreductase n=1 Tax=Clostridium grantii DSM 8605 TaxID=1121316 RepID=A0A1M5TNL8_9CLOT|nr:aldehyde ferredoxin oxidoreductase family protein [Clostridium grantii]SHH52261.1 aldehyde:ferredoxin oxidoreductase [Clostridium grantii DSM 8605]
MLGGYAGKILRIDLTTGELHNTFYDEDTLRKYLGGSGLGARILYDETNSDTDPLGPENLLIFLTGPTEGTRMPNAGRYQVITRSPLTGSWGEANSGGKWGVKLKKAGYDGVIFKGISPKPVYLNITEEKAELLDASDLWGKDSFETDEILRERHGKKACTCDIGIGGEKMSLLSCIMNDGVDGRTAGRCGVGAVMGSKKLKAICVDGNVKTPIINELSLNQSIKEWAPKIMKDMEALREGGTSCAVPFIEEIGDIPIKNWAQGSFNVENLATPVYNAKFLSGRYGCANCAIRCGRIVEIKEGPYKCEETAGPEYETLGLFGPNCLINDLGPICKANELCNRYGIDTIGVGNAVAFAMEAYERGLLTEEQMGCKARFGNAEDMLTIVHKIGRREDFGYYLADGTKVAAKVLGGIAEEFSVEQRGMGFPAHDPRYADSIGLQYAVSPRGACHLSANCHGQEYGGFYGGFGFYRSIKLKNHSIENKPEMNVELEHIMCLCDSLTICKFLLDATGDSSADLLVSWLSDITGWDLDKEELIKIGERIFNLKRMYLVRDGQSRKDDKLPQRMRKRRMTGGSANNIPDIDSMLDRYYEIRGWDEFGIPTEETLKRLDLLDTL